MNTDKFTNLCKRISRYNSERLPEDEQKMFWHDIEENAPVEDYGLDLLNYDLLISFSQSGCPTARYCLYKDDTFNYNNYLFEITADSMSELTSEIEKRLYALINAGFLTERYFWKLDRIGINEDTLSDLLQYYS